jgi:hypothetical protein
MAVKVKLDRNFNWLRCPARYAYVRFFAANQQQNFSLVVVYVEFPGVLAGYPRTFTQSLPAAVFAVLAKKTAAKLAKAAGFPDIRQIVGAK